MSGNPRPVTRPEAQHLKKLRCSDCWNPIQVSFKYNRETKETEDFVTCGTPDCPMHGFISQGYVAHRESESIGEYMDAKAALRNVLLKPAPINEAQTLAELGYS